MLPAQEMTRKAWDPVLVDRSPVQDGIPDRSDVSEALLEAGEDFNLVDVAFEAVWKARAHGASLIFFDILGPGSLSTPLPAGPIGPLMGFKVFEAREFQPVIWDWKGEPSHYFVTPSRRGAYASGVSDPFLGGSVLVHRSRLALVVGEPLSSTARMTSNTEGDPCVLHVLRAIQNLSQTDDAGAVLAQEFRVDVLQTDLESTATSDAADAFKTRMRLIQAAKGLLGMVVTTKAETFQSHTPTLSGWKDITESQRASFAAQVGWPQAILFGDAAQGMNVDSSAARTELNNWTATQQRRTLRRALIKTYDVIARSITGPFGGSPPPGRLDVRFHPLDELSLQQQSAVRLSTVQALTTLVGQNVMSAQEAREHLTQTDPARGEFRFRLPGPPPATPAPAPEAGPGAPGAPGGGTPGLERGPARALLGGRPDLPPDTTPQALDGGQGASGGAGGHVQKPGRGEGVEATPG